MGRIHEWGGLKLHDQFDLMNMTDIGYIIWSVGPCSFHNLFCFINEPNDGQGSWEEINENVQIGLCMKSVRPRKNN